MERSLSVASARKILGLQDGASDAELAAAYHHLAQMYHPDKVSGLAPEFQALAETRMREINAANDVIKQARAMMSSTPVAPSPRPSNPDPKLSHIAKAFARESAEARRLALDRDCFWEHLLTEELLRSKLDSGKREYDNFAATLLSRPKVILTGAQYVRWSLGEIEKFNDLLDKLQKLQDILELELLAAWGKAGEPSDPIKILDVVEEISTCCRDCVSLEMAIQSAEPPTNLKPLGAALFSAAAGVIWELSRLPYEISRSVKAARNDTQELVIDLTFPFRLSALNAELENLQRHPEWLTS